MFTVQGPTEGGCRRRGSGRLSTAMRLASAGRGWSSSSVRTVPGGRAGRLEMGGYSFDTGPTVLTMPDLIEDAFAASAKTTGGSTSSPRSRLPRVLRTGRRWTCSRIPSAWPLRSSSRSTRTEPPVTTGSWTTSGRCTSSRSVVHRPQPRQPPRPAHPESGPPGGLGGFGRLQRKVDTFLRTRAPGSSPSSDAPGSPTRRWLCTR